VIIAQAVFELVGPQRAVQIFGVRLVGVNAETGRKLLLSLLAIAVISLLAGGLQAIIRYILRGDARVHTRFWWRQPPVSTPRMRSAGSAWLRIRNSASSRV
jgi:hypothetical protein